MSERRQPRPETPSLATGEPAPVRIGAGDVCFVHAKEGYFEFRVLDDAGKWKPNVLILDDAEMRDLIGKSTISLQQRKRGART